MKSYYSYEAVDEFISRLYESGYETIQLNEGTLGSGDWVLIAPNDNQYNFVIREVALNEWSSGHTIRRCSKISKKLQAEIDRLFEEISA